MNADLEKPRGWGKYYHCNRVVDTSARAPIDLLQSCFMSRYLHRAEFPTFPELRVGFSDSVPLLMAPGTRAEV